MSEVTESDHKAFWNKGFVILRGVFSTEEIADLRTHAERAESPGPDLLSDTVFRDVVVDPRITGIARQLLGCVPVYFGDSVLSRAERPGPWHKDNAGRYDATTADWQGNYPLLRFGVYLQDHSRYSGGVSVRARSHQSPTRTEGEPVYMDTRVGDVVVWHFRATHRGATSLLRGTRIPVSNYRLDKLLPGLFKAPAEKARHALFITYGAPCADTERYIDYLGSRQYAVARAAASQYDAVWLASIDPEQVVIRDARPDIARTPAAETSLKHQEH